jgi:hypothetical protein
VVFKTVIINPFKGQGFPIALPQLRSGRGFRVLRETAVNFIKAHKWGSGQIRAAHQGSNYDSMKPAFPAGPTLTKRTTGIASPNRIRILKWANLQYVMLRFLIDCTENDGN